jgi:hypothetical protein
MVHHDLRLAEREALWQRHSAVLPAPHLATAGYA